MKINEETRKETWSKEQVVAFEKFRKEFFNVKFSTWVL